MLRVQETQMIEINLNAPTTPEEQQRNIVANVRLGKGEKSVPYMDSEGNDEDKIEVQHQTLNQWAPTPVDDGKPKLRFYAVGPNTEHIHCPLCNRRADVETVSMSGILGNISCLLSCLSCCFPIFTLSFVYYCCLHNRLTTKRLFCNSCGGHLSFYRRPT